MPCSQQTLDAIDDALRSAAAATKKAVTDGASDSAASSSQVTLALAQAMQAATAAPEPVRR